MAFRGRQLGQTRPAVTTPVSIYSPAANIRTTVKEIKCVNVTAAIVKIRIFHPETGSTFDEDTTIAWDIDILPGGVFEFKRDSIFMANSAGNLGVRTDTASAVNFTVYGVEEDI